MKVFLTGGTGTIGTHLIDYILSLGEREIHAIKRPRTEPYLPKLVKYYDCDVTDFIAVLNVIKEVKPDIIYHLAGQGYPKISESNPKMTIDANIIGTFNLLEAIKIADYIPKKIIITSSASVYGDVNGKYPTDEETQFHPLSLYAVTKVATETMGYQYFKNYGFPVVAVRPYIIIGKRQGINSSINSFAEQIARIEYNGNKGIVYTGNLNTSRDFLSVDNCVEALWLLSQSGNDTNGEIYNICSGIPRNIGDILESLISMSSADITVEIDEDKLRKSDIPLELGSNNKLKNLGWVIKEDFYSTLKEILDYWRYEV